MAAPHRHELQALGLGGARLLDVQVSTPFLPPSLPPSLPPRAPDNKKYPCIQLAYAAGRAGGTMTAALNAANERANEIFRQEKIGYLDIGEEGGREGGREGP